MFTKNRKKLIKSLHQKKYRDLHGLFLVEGEKMVRELLTSDLNNGNFEIDGIYAVQNFIRKFPEATEIAKEDMQSISAFKNASGVLSVVKTKNSPQLSSELGSNVLVLDNIKDPGNLGTIIRSAEWFGIKDVIISKETVELYNPKTVQSTMGSIFRVNIWREELNEAMDMLKKNRFTIYAADMSGSDIKSEKWPIKKALIIGSEAHGVSEQMIKSTDKIVSIVGKGNTESLNAGVAASIIISHW